MHWTATRVDASFGSGTNWLRPAVAAWLSAFLAVGNSYAARVTGKAEPATVRRGETLTIRLATTERVPGDWVDHYMLWTSRQLVPNPLRVEGPNYIVADGSKTGVFALDVSMWADGLYAVHCRSYYYAGKKAALQRLDTIVKVCIKGGPEPPRLVATPLAPKVRVGELLRLRVEVKRGKRLGKPESVALISNGQQIRPGPMAPLERSVFPIAGLTLGVTAVPTVGWRPQVLRCLAVHASFRPPGGTGTMVLASSLPLIAIMPKTGTLDAHRMLSYRGDRTIHLLTTGPGMHTFPYPTCQSWRADGKFVFYEGDGPRPDGTRVRGERQLMMLEAATGRQTHLASLPVENTDAYGPFHLRVSSQYHSDYAPGADLLVYYDMTGHHLYTLHPGRKPVEVLHETSGILGDPPAISRDGSRICYYVIAPGPTSSHYFTGRTSMIFVLDIDPGTGKALGAPRMVLAYPWRKAPFTDAPADWRASIACNHVQVCPGNRDRIGYAHEGGYVRNGEPENTRVWTVRADGSDNRSLGAAQEKGTYYTHEVFGPLGQYEYAVWGGSVARLTVANGAFKCIYRTSGALRAGHIGVSPDEKWIAADIGRGLGEDCDGNPVGGLFLIETATGTATFLAAFPVGWGHPRHVHPNFSPDGRKIGFTLAAGRSGAQIAYVDVSDLVDSHAGRKK